MRIIAFIENETTIKKILKHLNLWLPDNKSPQKIMLTLLQLHLILIVVLKLNMKIIIPRLILAKIFKNIFIGLFN